MMINYYRREGSLNSLGSMEYRWDIFYPLIAGIELLLLLYFVWRETLF